MLQEKDVFVLRNPLESGRQSPKALGGILFIFAFFQAGLFALEYYVAADGTIHPMKEQILEVHFWITAVFSLSALVFSLPFIYKKAERLQYLVLILISQNTAGAILPICALFIMGNERSDATAASILTATWVVLSAGLLIFVLTAIRFWKKLKRGDYREGTKADIQREALEYKSFAPMATVAGLGLFFVLQYTIRMSGWASMEDMILIVIGIGIYFAMMFVLPEQLFILYCKYRFKSFNFSESGRLKQVEEIS